MKLNRYLLFLCCAVLLSANTVSVFAQEPTTERAFKDDFKDDYSGRKYNYKGKKVVTTPQSADGKPSKYSEDSPYIKEKNNTDDFSLNFGFTNWLFIGILVLAVLYLAYTLLNDGSSGLFSSRGHQKIQSYADITADNIEHADIKSLISNAENANDYRLAIRYYYLLVLKQLTLKNLIKFEDDKTNADYMDAIASQKFSKDFAYTSYLYNYTWYGEFALNTEQYQKAKGSFVQLINQVST